MPTSFYIFLIVSFIALIPTYFDHGETWQAFKSSTEKKRRNLLKLLALWTIPALTIVGTIFLGIESVVSDQKDKKHEIEFRGVTNQLSIATNELAKILEAAKPKPLKQRIIDCLNSINPTIVVKLASLSRSMHISGDIEKSKFDELQKLASEPGGWRFIQIQNEPHSLIMGPDNNGSFIQGLKGVTFWIYPELLKKE